jgi:hypothetical protein
MKLSLSFILFIVLTGCDSATVRYIFPDRPTALQYKCPDLNEVPQDTEKLSNVLSVVTANYGLYYRCAETVNAWNHWYEEQQKVAQQHKSIK